ncbi:MAG TPA: diaminopimelate decarboxylase [Thermoanaerobaculia bacterium]|nr:diaminopimelate decarboxylase [Thermoanaerobaculia bacterium]
MSAGFSRQDGVLVCDGVSLEAIAREHGTPLYVYSGEAIAGSFRRFDAAFADVPHLVCYAAKANSNRAILTRLAALGSGADVVSGGELAQALASGIPAERIVFSGVGKTDAEIEAGVAAGILAFNAESERELEKIDAIARRAGKVARVSLRVNPDIDARSHPYISTGLKQNKFGIDIARAPEIFERARSLSGVRLVGLQAHVGSQIFDIEPLAETARDLAALAGTLAASGFAIELLDVGGGIGVGPGALSPEAYAAAVRPHLGGRGARVLIEPGRAIAGPAGALLTRVLYVKEERGKTFVVVDAGMNDLVRPALYQACHPIEPVRAAAPGGSRITADVVGPVCESADCFLRDAELPALAEGDLLALRDAGAYGYAMASNYNFRPRPAEVLVERGAGRLVRRRETFEDLSRGEIA